MKQMDLDEFNVELDERAELKILMESKERLIQQIKSDPEVATQFLKDIGLLDAEGNRVKLPGEEHLHSNGGASENGTKT